MYVSGTVPGVGDRVVNKGDMVLACMEVGVYIGKKAIKTRKLSSESDKCYEGSKQDA